MRIGPAAKSCFQHRGVSSWTRSASRMLAADVLLHIDYVVVRVGLVQPAGGDQTVDNPDMFFSPTRFSRAASFCGPSGSRARHARCGWCRSVRPGRRGTPPARIVRRAHRRRLGQGRGGAVLDLCLFDQGFLKNRLPRTRQLLRQSYY